MRFFCRSLAFVFLVGAMMSVLSGCVWHRPQPASQPKALETIATKVPKLAGLPLKQAEVVLSFVALKVGEVTLETTEDASLHGQVFGQSPAPGTPVRGGTAVDVKVYRFVPPEKEE
jgi:beta-lactam-binding protein with PASTA domain